ncbi:N-acetylmuramoyl-L-alanine amidase [Streptomyces sp. A1277]|uniref:peptidoglycan recognition protein family protein n=1 Tax=Streptomyces sp. A1277 TaxID=2563103 RepID=UPI0019D27222|nr:N-acetylmuramoyl-L-alanine amidase [Streptomyces sp. A1277]
MAWYPGAKKMELQPESDSQPAIKPTQFILHSIVAPWTVQRTYEYWRDSTNLESHFGLAYDGTLGQYIGTETRADATGAANRRTDGSGAVSLESASNLQASDPWTAQQVESIIRLGVWLHEQHGIPLRICRTASDPGFGYHRLHAAWNPDAHSCPGPARVRQFHDVIFPGIVARATGATTNQEDDMPTPKDLWSYKNTEQGEKSDAYAYLRNTKAKVDAVEDTVTDTAKDVAALRADVAALTQAVTALTKKVG